MTAATPPSTPTPPPSSAVVRPRAVAAGRGAAWWGEGIRMFFSSFWTWLGIMVVYIIISMLVGMVPEVGDFGHWLLTPVFMGGIMLGCRALGRGGALSVAHLFEGFQRTHFVQLLIIGVVNIGITLTIGVLVAAGVLGGFRIADWRGFGMSGDPINAMLQSIGAVGVSGALLGLLALTFAAVMAMLNWFAPALVAIEGRTAVEAMKKSFHTCIVNWLPFLVYGLLGIATAAAGLVLIVGLGLLAGAGAMFTGGDWSAMIGFALLFGLAIAALVLFIGPIMFASTYAAYADTLAEGENASRTPA